MNAPSIPHAGKPASVPLPYEPSPLKRILVVEDDLSMREFNTKVLINAGYQVDAAEDGAAAWDALQLNSYDLLVTDNDMPKVTGVELLKKLHAASIALPVIMATGALPQEAFTRQPWLQPAAVLLKPYNFLDLLGKVKEVLRATNGVRAAVTPPNGHSQPSTKGSPP